MLGRPVSAIALLFVLSLTSAEASEAVLTCRNSGIVPDIVEASTMACGDLSDGACEDQFKQQLRDSYPGVGWYDGANEICRQIDINGESGYPSEVRIR
jgi:hypothetical protein